MQEDEKLIAIFLPAWQESGVLKNMLLNTINLINYRQYFIFVGVYPNDPETQAEVDQVAQMYPHVIKVVNSKPGPTTKADNLNEIYRGLCLFERQTGLKFDIIVLSDSEDVHHPLSLKLFNYLMPRFDMIQIPIIPLELPWFELVGGVYMDEFAEMHLKELLVREKISRVLPSAGTSTAFWREKLALLEENEQKGIFNPKSLAEDYEIGIKLGKRGGRQIILIQYVERVVHKKRLISQKTYIKKIKEIVATRAFFPTKFRQAMRQRARWIYGICWQGLKNIGWDRNIKINYSLLRDRIAIFSNLLYFFGYLLIAYILITWVIHKLRPDYSFRPIVQRGEIWWHLALIVLGFFFWRILMRFIFVKKLYGFKAAALSPIRIIVGNILNFAASSLALFWLLRSSFTGVGQTWVKTEHEFPAEKLDSFRTKIGDLLLSRHLITPEQLERALAVQPKVNKKLGEILVDLGYITEEDLAQTLAYQKQWPFIEIDPFSIDPELLRLFPQSLAKKFRAFPIKIEHGELYLAVDRIELGSLQSDLENLLKLKIRFMLTTSYDLNHALNKAYSEDFYKVKMGQRLGEMLVKDGLISEDDLKEAIREHKKTGKILGEILIEKYKISNAIIQKYLEMQKTE